MAQASLVLGLNLAAAGIFCRAARLRGRRRAALLVLLVAALLASPLLILPRGAGLLRFIMAAMAVQTAFRLYDLHMDPSAPRRPSCLAFLGCQFNPFAFVWRRASAESLAPGRNDLRGFVAGTSLGLVAIGLMACVFRVNWAGYPFVLEHCAKVISFLLVIQLLLNGLAAGYRLAGAPASDFAGNFLLSATPAEFWRRYNRPAEEFFFQYVFRPAGGLHRPVFATFATFAFSAAVHEYLFDIAARRLLGYQTAFFLTHGAAAAMTLRLRLRGRSRLPATALNAAFNLATAYLFFAGMNTLVPFYVARHQ